MAAIEHLAIRSKNPEKLAQYYERVFGWSRLETWPSGAVHLSDGRINIAILPLNGNPGGLHHFGVHIDDLDEIGQRLESLDERLPPAPEGRPLAETRLSDLDGNQIDLSLKGYLERFGAGGGESTFVKEPAARRE
jgi:catechol 2,3-dioxygenase-like lactoylglutathione lyase family enzyme